MDISCIATLYIDVYKFTTRSWSCGVTLSLLQSKIQYLQWYILLYCKCTVMYFKFETLNSCQIIPTIFSQPVQCICIQPSFLALCPCLSLFITTSLLAFSFFGTCSYTVDVKSRKCQTNFVSQIVARRARQNYVIIVVLTGPLVIKTWWLTWVELALLAPHNAFISR